MKFGDAKDVALAAAVAAGAYLLYKAVNVAADIPEALSNAGSAVGNSVYDFFHPNEMGETLFYTVNFSNGRHAIPSSTVDAAGLFTYRGAQFRIKTKKLANGNIEMWAFTP